MIIPNFLKVNFTKGRDKQKPEIVVIHIADGDENSVISEFSAPQTQKSSHYLVLNRGDILQFVSENDTAYANGIVVKPTSKIVISKGKVNPNEYSLSIEHEGKKDINEAQYLASSKLIADICKRWNIPLHRDYIIGHREIRADKICPAKIDVDKLINLATEEHKKKVEFERQLSWIQLQINIIAEFINKLLGKVAIIGYNKDMNKKFGAFSSSADPNKLSMTFSGTLMALIPLFVIAGKFWGFSLAETELADLIQQIAGAISAIMIVYGTIRKFAVSIIEQK